MFPRTPPPTLSRTILGDDLLRGADGPLHAGAVYDVEEGEVFWGGGGGELHAQPLDMSHDLNFDTRLKLINYLFPVFAMRLKRLCQQIVLIVCPPSFDVPALTEGILLFPVLSLRLFSFLKDFEQFRVSSTRILGQLFLQVISVDVYALPRPCRHMICNFGPVLAKHPQRLLQPLMLLTTPKAILNAGLGTSQAPGGRAEDSFDLVSG